MNRRARHFVLLSLLFLLPATLAARSWEDLNEPDIHGSEREGKYPFDLFHGFISYENWNTASKQQRTMFNFMYLFRGTWYPKYRSFWVFPGIYSRRSLIDDRDQTLVFLYYSETEDGQFFRTFGPWWNYGPIKDDATVPKGHGLLPFYFFSRDANSSVTWILPTFISTTSRQSETVALFPFFAKTTEHTKRGDASSLWLLSYYSWDAPDGRGTMLLPFFATSDFETLHGPGSFAMWSPLYWSGSTRRRDAKGNETEEGWKFLPVPLFTYLYDEQSSAWNLMLLFGRAARYDGTDSTWYAIPVVAHSAWSEHDGEHSRWIAPLHYSHSITQSVNGQTVTSRTIVNPLYIASSEIDAASPPDAIDTSGWRIIPPLLFWHAYDSRGYQWSALALAGGSSRDDHGRLDSGSHAHTTSAATHDASFYVLPFYWNSSHTSIRNHQESSAEDTAGSEDTAHDADTYKHWIAPLYFSWKTDESTGRMTLPFFFYRNTSNSALAMKSPLYWSGSNRRKNTEGREIEEGWKFLPVPVLTYLYDELSTSWNLAGLLGKTTRNDGSGSTWYAFPLVAYSSWTDRTGEHNRWITPLFYSNHVTVVRDGKRITSGTTVNPLYIASSEVDAGSTLPDPGRDPAGPIDTSGWRIIPPLLFWHSYDKQGYRWSALALAGGSSTEDTGLRAPGSPANAATAATHDAILYVLPFYWNSSHTSIRNHQESSAGDAAGSENAAHDTDTYKHWIAPLYFSWKTEESTGRMTLPFFFYRNTDNSVFAMKSPLYWSGSTRRRDAKGNETEEGWKFLPVPLFTYLYDEQSSAWNLMLLFGRAARYDGTDSTWYAIPVVAHSAWSEHDGEHSRWIAPLHYSHSITQSVNGQTVTSRTIVNPLYIASSEIDAASPPDGIDTSGWRIIPPLLFWHSYDSRGYQWSALALAGGSSRDDHGRLDSGSHAHTTSAATHDASFYVLPFYWNSSHTSIRNHQGSSAEDTAGSEDTAHDADTYKHWIAPLYFSWKTDESTGRMTLPFFFYRNTRDTAFAMKSPLYWSYDNMAEGESHQIGLPLYYNHSWQEEGRARYTQWFLLGYWWSWRDSEGRILFPFYAYTTDGEKEWEFYLAGLYSGRNSAVRLERGGLYLDADAYVGFGLVSWSARLPLYEPGLYRRLLNRATGLVGTEPSTKHTAEKKPTAPNNGQDVAGARPADGVTESESAPPSSGPRLEKGSADQFARENTSLYNRWSVLFGWVTSIRADSRHHFRMLPFAWLTWDDNDENDKLTYWPFYIDYRNGEERYHAIFPLFIPVYGYYRHGASNMTVWGGPIYIDSYDAEKKEKELSILWPFYKSYESPTEDGHRLLPIFSRRHWQDEEGEHRRSVSILLHYAHSLTIQDGQQGGGQTTDSFFFHPLYISSYRSTTKGGVSTEDGWSFLLPLLLTQTIDAESSSWNVAAIIGRSSSHDGMKATSYLFPIFLFSTDDKTQTYDRRFLWPLINVYSSKSERESGFYVFPLLAYRQWEDMEGQHSRSMSPIHYWHIAETTSETASVRESLTLSPFWLSSYTTRTTRTQATGQGKGADAGATTEDGWSFLLPLLLTQTTDAESSSWNVAAIIGRSSSHDGMKATSYLFPFFLFSTDDKTQTYDRRFLWPLINVYSSKSERESGFYVFPLLAYRQWEDMEGQHSRSMSPIHYRHVAETTSDTGSVRESLTLSPLWFSSYTTRTTRTQATGQGKGADAAATTEDGWSFLLPLLLTQTIDAESSSWNVAAIIGRSCSHDGMKSTTYLFPFFLFSTDDRTQTYDRRFLWPLINVYSSQAERESGFYVFPLLAYRQWEDMEGQHSRSMSPIHYRHVAETTSDTGSVRESLTLSPLWFSSYTTRTTRTQATGQGKGADAGATTEDGWSFLLPLLLTQTTDAESSSWNVAAIIGHSSSHDGMKATSYLFPIFLFSTDDKTQTYDRRFLWPLINVYSSKSERESGFYVFPLLAYRQWEDMEGQHSRSMSPIHYRRQSTTSDGSQERSTWFALNLFHRESIEQAKRSETDTYLLWPLLRYQRIVDQAQGTEESHARFYPFLYLSRTGRQCADGDCTSNERWALLFPAWYMRRTENESRDWILGFYRHSTATTLYHTFALLYEYESSPTSSEFNALFHIFHYRNDEKMREVSFFYSVLGSGEWHHRDAVTGYAGGYEARFLLFYQRDNLPGDRSFKTALYPLYSYYSRDDEWSLFALPWLGYHERKTGSAFDMVLLGALWYRNENQAESQNTRVALGGLAYLQYSEPEERHYTTKGVLWGLLWQHETEADTQWSRVSALGGLYVDVDHPPDGVSYRRILGLRIAKEDSAKPEP